MFSSLDKLGLGAGFRSANASHSFSTLGGVVVVVLNIVHSVLNVYHNTPHVLRVVLLK